MPQPTANWALLPDASSPDADLLIRKKEWNCGLYPKSQSSGRCEAHVSKRRFRKAYHFVPKFSRLLQKRLVPIHFVCTLFGERIVADPPDRGCAYLLRPFLRLLVNDSLQRFAASRRCSDERQDVVGECRQDLYRQFAWTGFAGKDRKKETGLFRAHFTRERAP
jgi:hypothetical protein